MSENQSETQSETQSEIPSENIKESQKICEECKEKEVEGFRKYCPECAVKRKKESNRIAQRRQREKQKHLQQDIPLPTKEIESQQPEDSLKTDIKTWPEIKKSLHAFVKEFSHVKSYCIARPELEHSTFIYSIAPEITKVELAVEDMFSMTEDEFNERKFISAFDEFLVTKKAINEELDILNSTKSTHVQDVFVRMVLKFIRILDSFINFIMKNAKQIIEEKDIEPPSD